MADFDDAAALSAYKDWTGAVNTLWTIFSAVAIGFGGVATKVPEPALSTPEGLWSLRGALVAGWIFFALGNAFALRRAQTLIRALSSSLINRANESTVKDGPYASVYLAASASPVSLVVGFQLVLTLIITAILLTVPEGK